jgi:tetratricopeptide (TPR) repeat protein
MDAAKIKKAKEVFQLAADLPPDRRAAVVAEHCAEDATLKALVERLLAHDAVGMGEFLDQPAFTPAPDERPGMDGAAPRRIGRYEIIRVVGEGGMGIVYEARQEMPHRIVALKVIRGGLPSSDALRRFQHEAEILGQLQHPGIACVHEAGVAEVDGGEGVLGRLPFFAMEFVRGESVTDYARKAGFATPGRLKLVASICDAVQHAHQKGVIHRDLKPANILVDESGQPKILDFGVARATDADVQTLTTPTDVGQLLGTVPYMSPEQVTGDPRVVDTRSDVYSLGVVLYELLSGELPYDVSHRSIVEAARMIREEEPSRLSSIKPAVAGLRGDVETIVSKALEKDKSRRYQSAGDLAGDIRRYLANEPILARPPSTLYQLRKFAGRNRVLVTGVVVAVAAFTWGMVNTTLERNRALAAERVAEQRRIEAESQRAEAERQAAIAQAVNDFLNKDLLSAVDPNRLQGRDVTVLDVLEKASGAIEGRFEDEPLVEAAIRLTLGDTYMSLGQYDLAEPHLQRALAIRSEELGEDHADTLKASMSLGFLHVRKGRYPEAESLFLDCLERYRRTVGTDDPDALSAMGVLGVLYKRQGRYAEAEPLYVAVLEARRRVLGDDHRHTIVSMNNLGILYRVQERYDKAEKLYVEALELSRRALGESHPDTLNLSNGLAVVYKHLGQLEKAESLYMDVLEARRSLLGPEHPSTLQSVNNLANFYMDKNRFEQAVSLLLETLETRRRVLGREHPITLGCQQDLGVAYVLWGRYEQAEAMLTEALEARRRVSGEEHPRTTDAIACLAALYDRWNRPAQAEPLFREAREKRARDLGEDHHRTLKMLRGLVKVLVELERFEEAEPLAGESYERHRKVFGPTHDQTQETASLLVRLYDAWGKPNQADVWRAKLDAETKVEAQATP